MSFSDNLKRLRSDKGWTQQQLATRADLKGSHIPKLEADTGDPKLSTIYKLMNAFGCSADTLLQDTDKMSDEGLATAMVERVVNLPDQNREILLHLIDKYCIAVGLEQAFSEENKNIFGAKSLRVWTEGPKNVVKTPDVK